jgi:hypothetical protein
LPFNFQEELRQARETLDSLQKSLQESDEQDKNDEASALVRAIRNF